MPRRAAGYKSAVEFLPDTRLREVVSGLNPWWTSGMLPPRAGRAGPHRVDARRKKDDRPLLLCGPRRCGKTSTIYRWIKPGVKGVQLEASRLGGTMLTSVEALQRFVQELSVRTGGAATVQPVCRPRSTGRSARSRQVLQDLGLT